MPVDRFFIDAELENGASISIEGTEAHHLATVSRKTTGKEIELCNGHGDLAEARVTGAERRRVAVTITNVTHAKPSSHKLILIQAIPLINRLDTIVEKGTELGMTELWLFPGERSAKKSLSKEQQGRLERVAISAMKQSGRLYLPTIKVTSELKKWGACPTSTYFGEISGSAPSLVSQLRKNSDVHIVIGPESGLTDLEEEQLKNWGAVPVSLHHNILRTDTAAIMSLGIASHETFY